jgi:hypothetical protein
MCSTSLSVCSPGTRVLTAYVLYVSIPLHTHVGEGAVEWEVSERQGLASYF